jgi:hypothetical protein
LNEYVGFKLLLARLGGARTADSGPKGTLLPFLRKKARISPLTREREQFEGDVRAQFEELKKKGLSIPISIV